MTIGHDANRMNRAKISYIEAQLCHGEVAVFLQTVCVRGGGKSGRAALPVGTVKAVGRACREVKKGPAVNVVLGKNTVLVSHAVWAQCPQ